MTVKAIDTRYGGRLFRSRIEARWAVFYDAIRVPWQYEVEGFELPVGRYLPDFYLPQQKAWIEIKGARPTDAECERARQLANNTGSRVFVFWGAVGYHVNDGYPNGNIDTDDDGAWLFEGDSSDNLYAWCICAQCGKVGIEFSGRSERLSCDCFSREDKCYTYDHPALIAAYRRANSYRF